MPSRHHAHRCNGAIASAGALLQKLLRVAHRARIPARVLSHEFSALDWLPVEGSCTSLAEEELRVKQFLFFACRQVGCLSVPRQTSFPLAGANLSMLNSLRAPSGRGPLLS